LHLDLVRCIDFVSVYIGDKLAEKVRQHPKDPLCRSDPQKVLARDFTA
jgi:hypothetical protein